MTNDLISREAALEIIEKNSYAGGEWVFRNRIKNQLRALPDQTPPITGDTSDGYHTFNELYHHRAVLFSVIVKAFPDKAWKARKHHDGSMYDGMFIVGIETPDGLATYHYDIDPYWDVFGCSEVEFAPEWDGHTAAQAIERIGKLEPVVHGRWIDSKGAIRCSECLHTPLYDYHGRLKLSKACPTCGANMWKEREE